MTVLRGKLAAFDAATYRADVRLAGASSQLVNGVAVSRAVPTAEMISGRTLVVETGDQPDPALFVVLGVVG